MPVTPSRWDKVENCGVIDIHMWPGIFRYSMLLNHKWKISALEAERSGGDVFFPPHSACIVYIVDYYFKVDNRIHVCIGFGHFLINVANHE